MAYNRFTLLALRLTQRPTFGSKCTSIIHRSLSCSGAGPNDHPESPSSPLAEPQFDELFLDPAGTEPESTEHELRCLSSVEGWESIRDGLRKAVTESAAMPLDQRCVNCNEPASLRCQRCGPLGFYCSSCFGMLHCQVNVLHIPEKWEVKQCYST